MKTLPELLKARATWFKDKPLFYFGDRMVTYREYHDRTSLLAAGLRGRGIQHGDRVAVMLPNGLDVVDFLWAVWKAGAVYVPLNPMFTPREVAYVVGNSEAKFIVTCPQYLGNVNAARAELPDLQGVVLVSDEDVPETIPYRSLLEQAVGQDGDDVGPDDIAMIMYTSGTTGKPKGAMLAHRGMVFDETSIVEMTSFNEHDTCLCVLPLFHLFAVGVNLVCTVISGASMVIQERFVVEQVMEEIQRHAVTIFIGVPTMLNYLVNSPELPKYNLRSLRFAYTGGAPVPVELMNAVRELFGCRVLEAYGMTESSAVMTVTPYYRKPRIGMAGMPLRGVPVRLVDENDVDVPIGEIGEIICSGPVVMKGYWKMPEATAEALRGGWLHSGDLGRMDEDGYIQIVGRLKEMIITAGFNIYPKEVEEEIYTHPAVLEVAVVGVPDEAKGEVPKAFVALKPSQTMTKEEFFRYCRGRLAAYKVPRQVQFVESLPKTPTGKITKVDLKHWGGS